jgi:serine O-acetyltransferase
VAATSSDGMSLGDLVRSDYHAFVALDPVKGDGPGRALDVLTQVGFHAVVLHRLGHALHRRGLKIPARLTLVLQQVLFGCELYPQAEIGPGLTVVHPVGVGVGAGVRIGARVRIHGGVRVGSAGYADPWRDGFPVIGDEVRLFDGAKVFGPVDIGAGARVGASVVLLEPLEAGATATAAKPTVIPRRPPADGE